MENNVSGVNTNEVEVPREDQGANSMHAYQAVPDGKGPFPGVLIIHEISGLNENIRAIAERFAQQGYAALAIDLFSGANRVTCLMQIFYGILIKPLHNKTMSDLNVAIDFLRTQEQVDRDRIGVVGFCMGGSYALQLASVRNELKAASVFYGQNPKPMEVVAKACPIIGSYPEKDFTAKAARELENRLSIYEIPYDIKIYPNARHSFFNDLGPSFDPSAAEDAWVRMMAFFQEYLQGNA